MQSNKDQAVAITLITGLVLCIVKIIYSFFDPYNVLDFIFFFMAGFVISRKLAPLCWAWGLVLATPAFLLCSFFVVNNGFASVMQGIGTSYAISLVIIPLAACIGILTGSKFKKAK
jgi:hypothetical protein